MPPKGYVGIEITARRKMLLREVMLSEGYNKPTDALDFAIAFAQRFVKIDAELIGDTVQDAPYVPDYLNYYVGDARSLQDAGGVGGLQERVEVGQISSANWRLDGLNTLRNMEATSVTLTDAIDFALTSYLMHSRDVLNADMMEYRDNVKKQVRTNAVAFRSELTQFRKDNMEQQERDARINGTKNVKKERKSKPKPNNLDEIVTALGQLKHDETGSCRVCTTLRNSLGIVSEMRAAMHVAGIRSTDTHYVDPQGNRVEIKSDNRDEIPF